MKNKEAIIVSPVITEKGFSAGADGQYVFKVDSRANKIEIKGCIEDLYKVKVVGVNTLRIKGKTRRTGWTKGKTASYKKAYVKLAEGNVIEELKA